MADLLTPDICVIGAGIGGLAAAAEASALGAAVVLVARSQPGGDHLNSGAVPSRALAAAAAHAQAVRSGGPLGIAADEPRINMRRVHDHVVQVMAGAAPGGAKSHLEALGIELVEAEGRFVDASTLAAGDIQIKARRFVIATGARAMVPAIPGLDTVPFFTSETIFDNTRKLTHLVIIGGGPTGLELAQSHRRLGAQVTVVETGAALAGHDPELAAIALQRLREEGVDIRERTTIASIQARAQGIGVIVASGEHEEMLDVSHILVADLRLPDLDPLELDKAGIKRRNDDRTRLDLTAGLRTTNRRVFAVGDAAGGAQYAHLAVHQARLVARQALLGLPVRQTPQIVPRIAYLDPEIAEVGLTEPAARERHGAAFRVVRAAFADNARARASRQAYGVAKLIVGRDGRIVGAGIVGDRAGELVAVFSLAVASRLHVRALTAFMAPHATLSEVAAQLGREYFRERALDPVLQRIVSLVRLIP